MAFKFEQSFNQGVNLDLDELNLPQNAVQLIKNMTANVNQNPAAGARAGANMGRWTPLEGNTAMPMGDLPGGLNICVGFYSSEQTNEGYFFLYNTSGNHNVRVIDGSTGSISIVYQGPLLPLQLHPERFIKDGRCTLELKSYIDPVTDIETQYKFLIFTNDSVQQYFISVTDSINTGSYTLSPYFDGAGTFYDPATLINLGVPTPLDRIAIAEVAPVPSDIDLQNQLSRTAFQFRVKFIDVFGRESEHGIISDPFISIVGGGCVASSTGLARCLSLEFDAGNPLVNQIQIEYRKWVGNDVGSSLQTGWIKYDVINKWVNSPTAQWYERAPNTTYFNASANSIQYIFCGDKNNIPIPSEETSRTEPGLPRTSNSVFSINKRIGLANNIRGFEPIDPAEIAKVTYSAVLPEEIPCTPPPLRRIIMYANIWRPFSDTGPTSAFDATGIIRKSGDNIVWGNQDGDCAASTGNSYRMDQVFGDQTNPGFIFYLAGTPYSCIARWGSLNLSTGNFTPNPSFATPIESLGIPMCQIEIVAPAGVYVLRGASHKATIYDSDYQSTSTYIGGYTTLNAAFAPLDRRNYAENPIKELTIDTTAGDVIYNTALDPMFVILDLSETDAAAIDGYLLEQEGSNTPIEMSPVYLQAIGSPNYAFGSFFTDHNGFFFGVGISYILIQHALATCDVGTPYEFITMISLDSRVRHGWGGGVGAACSGSGNWRNRVYFSTLGSTLFPFPAAARRTINQSVFLCDSELGVSNIPIVMTKGAVGLTDASGGTVIVAHGRYDYASIPFPSLGILPFLSDLLPDYSVSPESDDLLVFTRFGACSIYACGSCSSYLDPAEVAYIGCAVSRVTDMPDFFVKAQPIGIKGVQSGGRYGVGFWLFDDIGRHTFFQVAEEDAGFVNIPNLNDTAAPYPALALSQIGYSINPSFRVPTHFKKLAFGVTENTMFSDFLDWSADYVQFIDNTGQTNTVNPTHIRIYYGSLNEYKKLYNEAVNCSWQFIASSGGSTTGDVVQFIMNGVPGSTGIYFMPNGISSPVTYDSSGLFFVIDFKEELRGLTNGSLFRIIRPRTNQTNYLYYEQCLVLDIVDGAIPAEQLTGTIPYVDSYFVSRLIPVPILKGQPGALFPGATPPNAIEYTSTNLNATLQSEGYATANIYNNGVLVMSVNDALTAYPFYFESPSPSDFWGSHLASRGRIGVINPYEAQTRLGTEVALSATLSDRGVLNGLSYFEDKNTYQFDRNTWGAITAVLVEVGVCLFICKDDHFLSAYNQTQLSVSEDGGVSAQNQYGPFTSPKRPSGTPFGCSEFNRNTITKHLGKVYWLDSAGRLIMNNFQQSVDVSTFDAKDGIVGGYSGYLMNKIANMNIRNQFPDILVYPISGIDPRTNEIHLTFFQGDGNPISFERYYHNNLDVVNLAYNETLVVDLDTGMLKGMAPYTPEMYGHMPKFYSARNFITFKNGVPYKHHHGADDTTPPPYGNFYGLQCPCYVVPVVNPEPETVKRLLHTEVYCKSTIFTGPGVAPQPLFYVPTVQTEKGQSSRLMPQQFVLRDGFQAAAYLCALNTPFDPNKPIATGPHAITDGDQLQGRWFKVIFKTNDLWDGSYFELSSVINGVNGVKVSGK
jgi:hypothetical protein